MILAVACLFLIATSSELYTQTGTVDYVPNGGFEYTSKPDNLLGYYDVRFGKYSLFWRQFHFWTVPNETGTLPDWPIERDRVYNPLVMYQPVTCSSTDLYSQHLPDCVVGTDPGSLRDIPENWFGFEPIRLGSPGQKYAGLYYRLNGIQAIAGSNPLDYEAFNGTPATDWWREYVEVELLCPLVQGRQYTLSFWASLGEVSQRNIQIEARVSQLPYHTHPLDNCDNVNDHDANQFSRVRAPVTDGPQGYTLPAPYLLKNGALPNGGWVKVEGTFTATGDEKYLTIGYFGNYVQAVSTTDKVCIDYYQHGELTPARAYVYVDDVRLKSAGSVSCTCSGSLEFEPIPPNPGTDECCYKVILKNGGDAGQPRCGACTIESVTVRLRGSQQPILDWNSNASVGPVGGDGIPRELGIVCVEEFPYEPGAIFDYQMFGSEGQLVCSWFEAVDGCMGVCSNCDEFRRSVSISSINSGSNPCCFRLKLDASLLEGCAQIASVRMYRSLGETSTEIPSAAYNSVVATNFSGYLFTFCPLPVPSFAVNEKIKIVFKDALGDVVCEVFLDPFKCVCDCNSSSAELRYQTVIGPNGSCCFDIVVRNTSNCKIGLRRVIIREGALYNLSGSNSWTSGAVSLGGVSQGIEFLKSGSPTVLYAGQEEVIGRICPDNCVLGDLSTKLASVTYTVNGVPCIERTLPSSSTGSCVEAFDCLDFSVTVEANPIWNSECCWYGVYVKVDVCNQELQGMLVQVSGYPQHPVSSNGETLVTTWQCQPNNGGIIVTLKRADGSILCTKNIVIPSCSSGNQLQGQADSSDLEGRTGFDPEDVNVHSTLRKRRLHILDDELESTTDDQMAFKLHVNVIARSNTGVCQLMTAIDELGDLPGRVYLPFNAHSTSGKSIVRRIHVKP
jgi:hypothetical protein